MKGLILARYGQQVDVETPEGNIERIYLKRKFDNIVTGDKVILKINPLGIVKLLPRTSVLEKYDAKGNSKGIAANIDQLLLVIAAKPKPSFGLIDDYLVMAEALNIQPVIVLNKVDLLKSTSEINHILQTYHNLPYPIITISTLKNVRAQSLREAVMASPAFFAGEAIQKSIWIAAAAKRSGLAITTQRGGDKLVLKNQNFPSLLKILKGKTNILVGQSGVGKSSIIQHLIPDLEIRIGELSRQHGKHTTTTTRLYHLPHGGQLIDSPGIRAFTFRPMSAKKIAACFIEFQPYLGHCRFTNCQHINEPGCAILAALQAGNIAISRHESYQRLIKVY